MGAPSKTFADHFPPLERYQVQLRLYREARQYFEQRASELPEDSLLRFYMLRSANNQAILERFANDQITKLTMGR